MVKTLVYLYVRVAPLTGARIETPTSGPVYIFAGVAPLTGARIETASVSVDADRSGLSRPSRARGLKPPALLDEEQRHRRAPHGRAD